jgi:hypothetical protein
MVVFEVKELIVVVVIDTGVLREEEIIGIRLHEDVGRHGIWEREVGENECG